jgi:hypothetical protein
MLHNGNFRFALITEAFVFQRDGSFSTATVH